jgi:cellulose synthase/poly-beta-1,6-N-acetylglucosamine synthase-like glycosyltransferase
MALGVRASAAAADPSAVEFADETAPEGFPEIDCVRSILPAGVAAAAEQRAGRLGVGADRVLIAGGTINEDDYLRSLAGHLGVPFEPLDGMPRSACPVGNDRVIEAAALGLLPLTLDDEPFVVVAPRGVAARRLIAMIEGDPTLVRRFRFTSAERLTRFVLHYAGKALTARACDHLKQTWPMLSAAPPRWRTNLAPLVVVAGVTIVAAVMAPAITSFALELMLGAMFLAWLMLRLVGAFINGTAPTKALDVADDALPVYSIIAALYREAASVDGLLRAIERLDYPAEKLDVIIAVEADDHETRAAIAARSNRIPVTVIPVAAGGPRTKPKALNFALPFARGTFTVIYDAEDRPQPGQLRRVLLAFCTGGDELACVQARLCIDNTADSSLTRLFTAEYAGQFDVFLPGLATLGLPLPLGGSSNHFHTETLRKIGAWDPYNVTEDADLGMRLARFGYRSEVIDSTTYEEAPGHFGPWLRQRTRWFKGWMQTWLVHMRQPLRLLRDLGLPGFVALQLIVGGNVLAALVHPLFIASLIYSALKPTSAGSGDMSTILTWVYSASVAIGYVTSAFIGGLGLKRRGLLANAWVLLLTPLHWLLLSLAAWRAFYQLVVAPYAWEKTEHGLAKSSRLAANLTRSLLELERYFKRHKEAGDLPVVNAARNTSAARRRRPRAAA